MNENIIDKFISLSRLGSYSNLEEYNLNLILSKNLYIPLSVLEVSIRNAINKHFTQFYGNGWLINEASFLQRDAIKKITESKNRILERKETLTSEKLIAELSFGFWTSLFQQPYDKLLRFNNLKQIFSNLPKKEDKVIDRKYISAQLNLIRSCRNRIFHHEKITAKSKFSHIENDILEILNFLDIELYNYVLKLNSQQ
jgi:hypothetical protein